MNEEHYEGRDESRVTSEECTWCVDLSSEPDGRIARSAARLATLLGCARVSYNPNACACIDDLLGAVHALFMARIHGFQDRLGQPIELAVLGKRAAALSNGTVRATGKWAAGFYFNGALFRISSVYHRILKVVLGTPRSRYTVDRLFPAATRKYKDWTGLDWDGINVRAIHREVNTLKHDARGVYMGRTVTVENAISAVEELITLIEGWLSNETTAKQVAAM